MTTYVDNMGMPARVGGLGGRWSHLTADTPEELHELAASLGLKPSWYQGKCKTDRGCPEVEPGSCVHFHYDVVQTKRRQAIASGAQDIDLRQMGAIISARRQALRGNSTT